MSNCILQTTTSDEVILGIERSSGIVVSIETEIFGLKQNRKTGAMTETTTDYDTYYALPSETYYEKEYVNFFLENKRCLPEDLGTVAYRYQNGTFTKIPEIRYSEPLPHIEGEIVQ